MRLRVIVRRHGLPDTPIVWAADAKSTIYEFLEKINEIIPLESSEGGWDVADYACELQGYELLHFQPVDTVLKEEDEVLIRPLLTQDLKIRRISGRRQISSFGAQMLDGVVLGRPLLRLTDRPPIHIAPRKRRRITSAEEESIQDEQAMIEDQQLDDAEDEGNDQQLVLHADFNEDDSEEDDDFAPLDSDDDDEEDEDDEGSSENSDSEKEVEDQDIQLDKDEIEEVGEEEKEASPPAEEVIEESLAGVKDPINRAKIRELHAAFPSSEIGVCRHVMKETKYDLSLSFDAMSIGFPFVISREKLQGTGDLKVKKTRSKAPVTIAEQPEVLNPTKLNPHEMDIDDEEPEKEEPEKEGQKDDDSEEEGSEDNSDPMVKHYDHNGLPPGSIASGEALSFMADALNGTSSGNGSRLAISRKIRFTDDDEPPVALELTPAIDKISKGDASSEEESDDSSEDDSSDDDSSEVSSDSSSEEEKEKDASSDESSSSSDSDSDSSSDSSSDDDEPEEKSSKAVAAPAAKIAQPAPAPEPTEAKPKEAQRVSAPGHGLRGTQQRNDRRKKANALARYKERGVLPANTTIEEFKLLDPNQLGSEEQANAALETLRTERLSTAAGQVVGDSDKFELRRKELLASLAAGGVDVATETTPKVTKKKSRKQAEEQPQPNSKTTGEAVNPSPVAENLLLDPYPSTLAPEVVATEAEGMDIDQNDASTPANSRTAEQTTSQTPASTESNSAGPGPRRAKLDLGAGRRMLFGALGIKPPKTKKDEEKVQADLMKFVRQPLAPKVIDEPAPAPEVAVDEDPDAWKEKIIYRAVECVQENVELSEPPFPFKQRWDPQQWNDRNGKRKKDQRDQAQYYDEERPTKKQKRRKGKKNRQEDYNYAEQSEELNYDDNYDAQQDESMQLSGVEAQNAEAENSHHLVNGTQAPSEGVSQISDDLAVLPEDITTLSDLAEGAAKVGMTIAFKCLEMSEATKWQPKISPYRTAIVIAISDDGEIQLGLAMRDRKPGKTYDEETGERNYGKFEMPDDDEEMDEEDDGVVYHQYYDFVQPKILQMPPAGVSADGQMGEASQMEQAKGDTSATLSNEEGSAESQPEAQLSHVPETQVLQTLENVEPVQMDEVQEDGGAQNPPAIIVSAEPSQENAFDTLLANPVLTKDPVTPFTPGLRARQAYAEAEIPSAQISEENRRNIANLMQDAGFRSSVPSSIVRGIQPETPGDVTAFQKLMDEMAETPQETPYSPKFNGFESSPPLAGNVMQLDGNEALPIEAAVPSSAHKVSQLSWETVDSQVNIPTISPPKEGSNQANPKAEKAAANESESSSESSSDDSASPSPEQVKLKKTVFAKKVPTAKAQLLWEQLQPKSKRTSISSSPEQEEISQATSTGLDGSGDMQSNLSVQYPKLSDTSSVMSQIADHGRQPDFAFEYSEILGTETPRLTDSDKALTLSSPQGLDTPTVKPISKGNRTTDLSDHQDAAYESEVDLPAQRGRTSNTGRVEESPQPQFFSDDFPSIDALSQQSQIVKKERSESIEAKGNKANFKRSARPMSEEEVSEDEITPKQLGKQRKELQNRKPSAPQQQKNAPPASQPRAFQPPASQLHESQSRPTQSQPVYSSHVVDLTLTSNEAEPEEDEPMFEPEPNPLTRIQRFGDDDSDDFEGQGGWAKKSKSANGNGSGKRQPSGSFKETSQVSLNAKRKNAHR